MPEGLELIGHNAFKNCEKLKKVVMPNSVTTIGLGAFGGCIRLNEINLSTSLKYINTNAFYRCISLSNITLPESLESIEENAFVDTSLKTITIPKNVKVFGDSIFNTCEKLESVTINAQLEIIPYSSFFHCLSLKEVNMPESVKKIGPYAFAECDALTSLTIPCDKIEIDANAFSYSALKQLVIKGAKSIYSDAFKGRSQDLVIYSNDEYVSDYCETNNIEYSPLNEGLHEELLESKQDKENFKKWITQKVEDKYAGMPSGNKEAFINNWVNGFEEDKSALKPPLNDYYYWIKKDDFDAFTAQMFHLGIDKENKQKAKDGAQLIYNKDGWQVYKITNYQASAKYGKGTRWCISGSKRWSNNENGEKYWNEYSEAGVVFYFFINGNRKYALAVYPDNTTYEIFDDGDNSLGYIPNAPIIEEIPVDYTSKDDYREFYNAVASAKLPDWQYIYEKIITELSGSEEGAIAVLDTDTFIDYADNYIPEGFLEHQAVARGDESPEWYKEKTGDDYEEYWGGDIMPVSLDYLVGNNHTKEDALKELKEKFKDKAFVIYDSYIDNIMAFDSYEDLIVHIIQICYEWENYKDGFDQFVDSCINITRLLIKQGEENIDDFTKLGISKEFLEKEE